MYSDSCTQFICRYYPYSIKSLYERGDLTSRFNDLSKEEILYYCLSQRKEGDFWDFKQEWHERIEDLIKDIFCFANTTHDENCYLIFGISDDFQITGMASRRYRQSEIIDALHNLQYGTVNIPEIQLNTVLVQNREIDILTIFNTDQTPIFLRRNYGKMKAGCIYTRVRDKNTPDNGNANMEEIENLWKKRFGLTKPPLQYIYEHLSVPEEWTQEGDHIYNIYKPEYVLLFRDEDDFSKEPAYEFYSYAMTNESTTFRTLEVSCHGTTLDSFQTAILDSGRYETTVPEWGFLGEEKSSPEFAYKYFIKGTPRYYLHRFLYHSESSDQRIAHEDFMEVILLFENDNERKCFEQYILDRLSTLRKLIENETRFSKIYARSDNESLFYSKRLRTGFVLNKLLSEYRLQNKKQ